jgi:hypothetical protein
MEDYQGQQLSQFGEKWQVQSLQDCFGDHED